MRVIWEESDVRAGRRFGDSKSGTRGMIGYVVNRDSPTRYVVVSLNDGMIITPKGMTKKDTAEWLSSGEYLPDELLEKD